MGGAQRSIGPNDWCREVFRLLGPECLESGTGCVLPVMRFSVKEKSG